jgi:glycosyltransferase involved in cell wall biosynthesis
MRILCLSNMYPGPGAPDYGAFIATMCDALERLGHDVDRVVIDTRAHGGLATPRKYLDLTRRGMRAARSADVIYAHYLFPTGAIAALASGRSGVPWVLTAHGGDVRNLDRSALGRLSGPGVRGAHSLIVVSRFLAEQLRARLDGLPPVRIINMGVDLRRFRVRDRAAARSERGLQEARPLVLSVGGLNERKNPLRLLQAFSLVRRRVPGAQLVFVGEGPLRAAIQEGARMEGLSDAVTLTGALRSEEVAGWMAAADMLVLPSLVEPLGVVALEAMASGRPVVATRVGGTAEVVGRAGVLVDPLDPRAIADGVLSVFGSPPSPAECRSAAAANSVDRQAVKVADVLAQAAAASAGRRGI